MAVGIHLFVFAGFASRYCNDLYTMSTGTYVWYTLDFSPSAIGSLRISTGSGGADTTMTTNHAFGIENDSGTGTGTSNKGVPVQLTFCVMLIMTLQTSMPLNLVEL
eukprot:GHVU01014083.1.p1 GENE.GHVU01014083.1~~GHVU01014083.1.p1  ORF type:complete len:106 (-),score=2.54 GHVU01014083.1:481-798(-)